MKKIILFMLLVIIIPSVLGIPFFSPETPPPLTRGALSTVYCEIGGSCFFTNLTVVNMTTLMTYNATGAICLEDDCIYSWQEVIEVWNLTGSKYIINSSGILDINETQLNRTIKENLELIITISASSLTGFDGDNNRKYTLVTSTEVDIRGVWLDGVRYPETYCIKNDVTKTITFNDAKVFDYQIIEIEYLELI